MTNYDDLAARDERGELAPIPGTDLHGSAAADAGRAMLMDATGTDTLDDAMAVALGRPRFDAEEPAGPMWKVRATKALDEQVEALAKRQGHNNKSRIIREATAAYIRAS
ncbi:ribbon-helix-helix protein, CopG family [Clavibacter michiganensis subsp. michiganensis]|uniref:ribbon-helix-helix protein, CopG family n=1 Tax=Clavibacter michiganensis TaxID=28447 RepID=UPI001D0A4B0C|nr:ribbon-helix-helix protein, CopG family [Clavibacter michiganensis]UDM10708.1 ribbon-helix-helix protein, CopG family [Clavibacter michiganensis subsp. michiganensis]WDD25404.1 ribbon-helix-helix protein, CopG family [Clavibacter michiganensis subsp. michiganensis]WDD28516.1 ribbon-helix-helix protein, CopG family [Clavibacter michiganensis subsp. michiganensis]